MNNPHSGKTTDDPDVETILIHADERMRMMSYLKTRGVDWDTLTYYNTQEVFDLYLHHRFDMMGQNEGN